MIRIISVSLELPAEVHPVPLLVTVGSGVLGNDSRGSVT